MALWYIKYRPKDIENYVFRDEKLKTKVSDYLLTKEIPHLLIHGPSGTGKTTLSNILANSIAEPDDILSINASLDRGVDTVRTEIINFCQTGSMNNGLRIIILDEFDNFTNDAQLMLRATIQDYSESVRFIVTANYPQKINAALHSRLTKIEISSLDYDQYLENILNILIEENIDLTDSTVNEVDKIIKSTMPDMRLTLNTLQDNLIDGSITTSISKTKETNWENILISLLNAGAPVSNIREVLAGLNKSELDNIYKYLWDNTGILFPDYERDAIILIANEEYKHSLRYYPEIGIASLLIQLDNLKVAYETGN